MVHLCTRPHQKKKTASEIEGSEYYVISMTICSNAYCVSDRGYGTKGP